MSQISTHILDTSVGRPASGVTVELSQQDEVIASGVTDGDGRLMELGPERLEAGTYRLRFATGEYFQQTGWRDLLSERLDRLLGRRPGGALPRPAPHQPVRVLDLQGELTMPAGDIVLGANQYGKAEVRVVRVTRDTERHEIEDLSVTSQLRGDFDAAHRLGDNANVVATDTQKNTVFAFAKDGIGTPEDFLLRLGKHFVDDFDWVTGGRWAAEQYSWRRIHVGDEQQPHSFVRGGTETRTAVVIRDGRRRRERDLRPEGPRGSQLHGFGVRRLPQGPLHDVARDHGPHPGHLRHQPLALRHARRRLRRVVRRGTAHPARDVRRHVFARHCSSPCSRWGRRCSRSAPRSTRSGSRCPNLHHFLVDLAPFGLENPNEVFYAADRPYGLIEATIEREGAAKAPWAWEGIADSAEARRYR